MEKKFKAGQRVRHATKTEWGIGEVLIDQAGDRVSIFFEDVGAKEFIVDQAKFTILNGAEGVSDYLSSLVKHHHSKPKNSVASSKSDTKFFSFKLAIEQFLKFFPLGFNDPKYNGGDGDERKYKEDAHKLMVELLNQDTYSSLLQQSNYQELIDRIKKVINKTNLISPYEKIWLTNGINQEINQKDFAASLFSLLYATSNIKERFEDFSKILSKIGAAKWPIATYFLFIRFPETHMFLKPIVTQEAASTLNQEINYKPELNWLTYSQVLSLAERISTKLKSDGGDNLNPRDMIDVQSFIWVVASGYES